MSRQASATGSSLSTSRTVTLQWHLSGIAAQSHEPPHVYPPIARSSTVATASGQCCDMKASHRSVPTSERV